jgi:hypothetical protein
MSMKRINSKEKVRRLIGKAVMRQFLEAPRDPETKKEIAAVGNWLAYWLTTEELKMVIETTGTIFDEEVIDELCRSRQLYFDRPRLEEPDEILLNHWPVNPAFF